MTKNLPTPITCRVYVLPGKTEEAKFALSVTPLALEYFTELFGVAYPLPKMDLITIPDFESGAMENWGLVTYRSIRLLFNEKTSDLSYKRHIAVSSLIIIILGMLSVVFSPMNMINGWKLTNDFVWFACRHIF